MSRFFVPSPPHPLSQRSGGPASKRPVEAAAPAAGMDALRSHSRGCAPTPAWKTLCVFHSRLDAVLRSPVRGPASTSSHRPLPQGYFLDGSTISSKVTFLDGLTGGPVSGRCSTALGGRRQRDVGSKPKVLWGGDVELPVLLMGCRFWSMDCRIPSCGAGAADRGVCGGTARAARTGRCALRSCRSESGRRCFGRRGHANRTDSLSSACPIFPLTGFSEHVRS